MSNLFTGLSAFPLTPLRDDTVDEASLSAMVERLCVAGVDSITALGSTGSYAYLDAEERSRVASVVVQQAGTTPVFVGVGALRTSQVLVNVWNAEKSGAKAVLLAPMTYQPLTEVEVFELFRAVTQSTDLPVIVYDNPGTTHFTFSVALYGRIAELPGVASIKIPAVSTEPEKARAHIEAIRAVIPDHVTIGVSGDASAATGLLAGCDAWYSVTGGTLPDIALAITRAAQQGRAADAYAQSERLAPLWDLFAECGSLRVIAAIAAHLGLAPNSCLPLPVRGLTNTQQTKVAAVVNELGLS
ncbi:dihydrodipicolinate synthase family protein [Mycolicibacterium iranicum]|uniref:dihydrodipicolinate synthase family protein n=1 Tax=Mycolicibacterium iranicum TaxID=912594 RepID=UPI0004BAE77A|nr:dihydrodipicolinate synthase family protein [Mycolicibacterium iranicum]